MLLPGDKCRRLAEMRQPNSVMRNKARKIRGRVPAKRVVGEGAVTREAGGG